MSNPELNDNLFPGFTWVSTGRRPPATECMNPDEPAIRSYRLGCRCHRCYEAKVAWIPPTECAMPDCTNPRRKVQRAKYCEEHATSIRNKLTGTALRLTTCTVCDAPTKSRTSTVIALCEDHQRYRKHIKNWKAHHVDSDTMRRWLTDVRCWICTNELYIGWGGSNPDTINVDHSHACCAGERSCGQCVRGLAHARCNHLFGQVEAMAQRVGLDRLRALLDHLESETFGGEGSVFGG